MKLYGNYTAEKPCMIDFIEIEFSNIPETFIPEDLKGGTGLVLSVDWDESDWDYNEDEHTGTFRTKGVYINQMYANGCIEAFRNAKLISLQVCGDSDSDFMLTKLNIIDGISALEMPSESIKPECIDYVD